MVNSTNTAGAGAGKSELIIRHRLGMRPGAEPYRIDRGAAERLGHEALDAIHRGSFIGPLGEPVDWRAQVKTAISAKVSIPPDHHLEYRPANVGATLVEITDETTLDAANRLTEKGRTPLSLNYANGIHPGGGFLHGARAQEEALCRASALYATLVDDPMYAAHRRRPLSDSTNWAILSPRVPVFRDGNDHPLAKAWPADFLTCAAPVADKIGQQRSADLLGARLLRVLEIARSYGYRSVVLGAWGCGAFHNDPGDLARRCRDALEGPFAEQFELVVFAIPGSPETSINLPTFLAAFPATVDATTGSV